MENQKPLTSTQIELIRLVMKQASDEDVIREMQGIISRFRSRNILAKPGASNAQLAPCFARRQSPVTTASRAPPPTARGFLDRGV